VLSRCARCRNLLTFFFQVAFAPGHVWHGWSLAVFACTCHEHSDDLIPEMLNVPLRGAVVPREYLRRYQTNFRFITFQGPGVLRSDYVPRLVFQRIVQTKKFGTHFARIGGQPWWRYENEAPSHTDDGTPMEFLMQLDHGAAFQKLPNAPPQVTFGLTGPEYSEEPTYELFIGNAVYFFGCMNPDERLVYAITQKF
jgi:hypothetical protein